MNATRSGLKTMLLVFGLALSAGNGAGASDEVFTILGKAKAKDGDSLMFGGLEVRLHGIDAPESDQTCKDQNDKDWACGHDARAALERLVRDRDLRCEVREVDQYSRPIGHCFAGETNISEEMMKVGMAWAFVRYSKDYVALEADAQREKVGVWRGTAEAPWDFRAKCWERAAKASPNGCPIKGNISVRGERIYHMPCTRAYKWTLMVPYPPGKRWFCTEREAIDAGWRRAKR
jgi:endonuclease YncB( thermonuclease family)